MIFTFLINPPWVCFTLILVREFCFVSQTSAKAINECPEKCGTVQIPYPFGVGNGCFLPGFEVSCNLHGPKPVPFVTENQLQVLSISNGELRVNSTNFIAMDCADHNHTLTHISLPKSGPFTISNSNSFMAVGCDTVAVVADDNTFASGCVSLCSAESSVTNGSCTGVGCCESAIPNGIRYLALGSSNMFKYRNVKAFDNCSYTFVVERGSYTFKESDLRDFPMSADIAMKLEWAIGHSSCPKESSHVCGKNSYCIESNGGLGYLCNCSDGFAGNPYLNGSKGCQDVDECLDPETSPCVLVAHCHNEVPGYRCVCPFGSAGDGKRHGSGCRKIFQVIEAILGTCLSFILMLLCGFWFYCALKKRTLMKLREQYFQKNGGLLLKQQVSSAREGADCARIFSLEELKEATQNYDDSRILGTGGYGTVYKGILEDGMAVAIKKSKVMDQNQIDQFINEVVILTQINHRNIVKLLGCCLETEVPMLVYEFISNGTLHKHIHENVSLTTRITWPHRLRIAIETAEALAYLHHAASMPIFHRDVKSSNILLDEHYTVKVADFGISRLVPLDQTQIPTLVQGTLGYLDPEYFQTSQLTAKSDVYSFGVVLVELLTGQKPVSFERSREDSNLAMYFLSSLKSKDLEDFLEEDVLKEGEIEQLRAIAKLARKCLLLRGDKRPTMKEVARELVLMASLGRQTRPQVLKNEEENEHLAVNSSALTSVNGQNFSGTNLTVTFDLAR